MIKMLQKWCVDSFPFKVPQFAYLIRVVASVRLVTSHWLHADANDRAAALRGRPKVLPVVPRNVQPADELIGWLGLVLW